MLLALQMNMLLGVAPSTSDPPAAFTFIAQNNVAVSTSFDSNIVTITGLTETAESTVVNGEQSVDGGAFTSLPQTISIGGTLQLRQTSSAIASTAKSTTATIVGVSGSFTTTTAAEVLPVGDMLQIKLTAGGLVRGFVNERSSFKVTASFYSESWVATAPTSAAYRIDRVTDDPSAYQTITDWTELTPATSITILITAAQNAIQSDYNRSELHQVTVVGDSGLDSQCQQALFYTVRNIAGQR